MDARGGFGALVLAVALVTAAGAQTRSLYADPKAREVGDALTVIIEENASATNRTGTSTDKSNKATVSSSIPKGGNILDFVPLHALDSQAGNKYQGQASTSRSANLSARMTVTVVGRKPNGDLLIEGVRTIKINGETESIFLNGAVSPVYVRNDNTVLSSNVADLQIEYTGKGTITQGSRPGLLVRLVNWVF
jgi:flagellar L-ring protein precursor FlgH